jgi:putative redox protein
MSEDNSRSVEVRRISERRFEAINRRGGRLLLGEGADADFTPVELLLTAIAGCSAIDVDYLTSRRAEPKDFEISVAADKLNDAQGNHLGAVEVTFRVTFAEGPHGDAARAVLPQAVAASRDRLCTVSRTVQLPTPVQFIVE